MAPKKSKAKKPTETMRQKQMRLRREAAAAKAKAAAKPKSGSTMVNRNKPTMRKLAAKAAQARKRGQGGRPLVRRAELDKANKPSIKRGASALRGRANAPKISARMEARLKAARATRGVRGALGKAGRALVPVGAALEVKSMADRSKRDAERNRRLGRRPFEELRADNYKPNPKRRGQGSRPGKPGSKPKANPKAVAALTKPGGLFYRGPAPGSKPKPKPKPAAKTAAKPASKPKPAAKPAPKKAAATPKKVTKKVSGVGPVKSGRSYSVQKTGKSVMQQQAAELRKMREASKKRQAANKAKSKKKK